MLPQLKIFAWESFQRCLFSSRGESPFKISHLWLEKFCSFILIPGRMFPPLTIYFAIFPNSNYKISFYSCRLRRPLGRGGPFVARSNKYLHAELKESNRVLSEAERHEKSFSISAITIIRRGRFVFVVIGKFVGCGRKISMPEILTRFANFVFVVGHVEVIHIWRLEVLCVYIFFVLIIIENGNSFKSKTLLEVNKIYES